LDFCYFASNSGGISHDLIQRIFKSIWPDSNTGISFTQAYTHSLKQWKVLIWESRGGFKTLWTRRGFEVPLSDNRWKRWFSRYFGGVPDSYFVLRCLHNFSF
jgi:hypothetical protein